MLFARDTNTCTALPACLCVKEHVFTSGGNLNLHDMWNVLPLPPLSVLVSNVKRIYNIMMGSGCNVTELPVIFI